MHRKSKIQIMFEIAVRVLLVTCIFTLLGFAFGLFCGIAAALLLGLIRHAHPDMTMAYRFSAVPIGIASSVITFLAMLFTETRRAIHPSNQSGSLFLRRTS
jgi:uncharacterized BrkB/YihY/UPF0761 family membrane protein